MADIEVHIDFAGLAPAYDLTHSRGPVADTFGVSRASRQGVFDAIREVAAQF